MTLELVPEPACGSEMSYRKPPGTNTFTRIFQWELDTGENQPMTERETSAEIMIRLTEHFLELVSVYKEAMTNFAHIFLLNKAC